MPMFWQVDKHFGRKEKSFFISRFSTQVNLAAEFGQLPGKTGYYHRGERGRKLQYKSCGFLQHFSWAVYTVTYF